MMTFMGLNKQTNKFMIGDETEVKEFDNILEAFFHIEKQNGKNTEGVNLKGDDDNVVKKQG